MYPCGAVLYRYLPQGVLNVVRCRSSCWMGTLWYPFQASKTNFFVPWGTGLAWWNGEGVWWVSRVACTLSGWKSTVRRDLPSFFAHITILWHHVTGSPMGRCSISPSRTSWSSHALTSSCQCIGKGTGEWRATGLASGATIRRIGGPLISGRVWCSHVLKVLDLWVQVYG